MTDILASLGLVELKRYEKETLPRRKEIFELYERELSQEPWVEIPISKTVDKESSYHLFMLRIKNISESKRDAIIQKIFDQDVSVNVHFQPLPILTQYKKMGYRVEDYPVAFDNYSREISLPVYYDLTNEQVIEVCRAVKNAYLNA